MGLRDIIHKIPDTKQELRDYIISNYPHIRELIEKNPQHKNKLNEIVNSSFDKYSQYVGGWSNKLSGLGHVIGYTADAWLLATGDIVGTLGGKYLNLLSQIPEKAYSLVYGARTGNYLDSAQNILEGLISYIPGLTFVDQGLTRIIKKRIVRDTLNQFEKEVGIYKPWTTRLSEKLSKMYKSVKDRFKNIFTPKYEPLIQTVKC